MKKQLRRQRRGGARPPEASPGPPRVTVPPEGVPIFWVERTGVTRYHRGFHCNACRLYAQEPSSREEYEADWPEPRPIRTCECGQATLMNTKGADEEFCRPDTGEVFERPRDLPVGAVWEAAPWRYDDELSNWVSNTDEAGQPFPEPPEGEGKRCRLIERRNEDGRVLIVMLPDRHDWVIDSRCNNCTLPLDDVHWCWNRSGRPEDGTLDVRKGKPGQTTCSAGAGSIQTGRWHGFLHNGRLVQC